MESRRALWLFAGLVAVLIASVAPQLSCDPKKKSGWRAIAELPVEVQEKVLKTAKEFGAIEEILNVWYPRILPSHTRYVTVWGRDKDGFEIAVGVDPSDIEVVKMVRLCPRREEDAADFEISAEEAKMAGLQFLTDNGIEVSDEWVSEEPARVHFGPGKKWRLTWRHIEDGVTVLPDFIVIEVNASRNADSILFSKVLHEIEIGVDPRLTVDEAVEIAKGHVDRRIGLDFDEGLLAIVYPYQDTDQNIRVWSHEQALCWILRFSSRNGHFIEIWVDALTGKIQGRTTCHSQKPEVFGIDDPDWEQAHFMRSHLDKIWFRYLDMMKFDVGTFLWTNVAPGVPKGELTEAIENGRYLVVACHGDRSDSVEKLDIAYTGVNETDSFLPEDVPQNNLRFAYLGVCFSGHDGDDEDFLEKFVAEGADVFVGQEEAFCPLVYEERLLPYLAQGFHLANAHSFAVADVSTLISYSDKIVFSYSTGCLNKVRLAPLLVDVTVGPSTEVPIEGVFTVFVQINNREDVRETSATNVKAEITIPSGFTLTGGDSRKLVGTVDWNSPKNVQWTVEAPATAGTFTFDVEVWSENLGVQVADPGDPYHKFDVNVS